MSRLAPATPVALLLALAMTLAACSGNDVPPTAEQTSDPRSTAAQAPAPSRATPASRPADRACYRLGFDAAVAPTTEAGAIDCARPHTSMTYAVGTVDTVVKGHLLAVDSARVQAQVARTCPHRLPGFLGATPDELRLSMLRAVWFTPSVAESDSGADWYRCDVIAVSSDGRLAPLTGRLAGLFTRPAARAAYGMCGTAEPGTEGFSRVICAADHSWRAIRTVAFASSTDPGVDVARESGGELCKDAARERAADALNFRWGYEWPSAEQWDAGQTYGLCWIPD